MLTARPKVAEIVFQLYGRPLHPELFQVYSAGTVTRGEYEAKIEITGTGHIVTWRHAGLTLTEVTTSAHHSLPERRRLMSHRLKGERTDKVECRGGIAYHCELQLETADPEVFWMFQEELTRDGEKRGLLHHFGSGGRIALGAVSYINVEARMRSLLVQAFHTFPDDYAIVKTQSLYKIP